MADRDEKGRFIKGNSGGGRPKGSNMYYEILRAALTEDDWTAIILKAIEQGRSGNKDARKFLAEYSMGEPERYLNVVGNMDINLSWDEYEEEAGPEDEAE